VINAAKRQRSSLTSADTAERPSLTAASTATATRPRPATDAACTTIRPPPAARPARTSSPVHRDYISYSAISTYQRCPLRYYFAYVARLAPEFISSSLIFGGALHSALEHHCRRAFEGADPPTRDELLAVYQRAWEAEATLPVQFGRDETAESLSDLAQRMLAAFQDHEVSKMDTQLLAVEEEFRAPIIPDCPDLLGRLDLVHSDRSALRIVDFKTSRGRWNESKVQEAAPQMLLYAELVRPMADALGLSDVQLEWVVITKTRQPVVEMHALTPDPRQIARTKATVRRAWQAIASGHFYPAPSPMSCAGCPYGGACQKWEG
jgi:RecB family exonuclease